MRTTPSPSRPNPPRVDPGDDRLTGRVLYPVIQRVFGAVYADHSEATWRDQQLTVPL